MLLLFVEQQKNWTISKLAKRFEVSERTIRNDISDINDYLKQQKITQIQFGGSGRLIIEKDIKKVKKRRPLYVSSVKGGKKSPRSRAPYSDKGSYYTV